MYQNTCVFESFTGDDVFLTHESLAVTLTYSGTLFLPSGFVYVY